MAKIVPEKPKDKKDPLREFWEETSALSYQELAALEVQIKAEKSELKSRHAELEKKFDILTINIIPEKLAEDNFSSVNLTGGGRIQMSKQAYCSVTEGNKEALFKWLRKHKQKAIIGESVNSSTLKAFVMEQIAKGNPVPDEEIINYQPYMRASVVGVKR